MPLLSNIARRWKCRYFMRNVPKSARILEVGCGNGWFGRQLRAQGWNQYTGLDLNPPADIQGDIRAWRECGLTPAAFDIVMAWEVIEHVDCLDAMRELLKPGGLLMLTSPVPSADPICRLLEKLHLTQPRTSPHEHLRNLRQIPGFATIAYHRRLGLSQWGLYRKVH